jgi:hypothetical protein
MYNPKGRQMHMSYPNSSRHEHLLRESKLCGFAIRATKYWPFALIVKIHKRLHLGISNKWRLSFHEQYNKYRVSVSKTGQKIGSHFNWLALYLDINLNLERQSFVFFCCQIQWKLCFISCIQNLNEIRRIKLILVFSFQK